MPEEIKDAKLAEQSSSSETVNENVNTSTQIDEKSTVNTNSNGDVPFHEHPRFKELIEEKNVLKQEVETLRRQNAGNIDASKNQNLFENAVTELVNMGIDRTHATKIVQQQIVIAQAVTSQQINPIMQNQQILQADTAVEKFSKSHDDYEKLRPEMSKILSTLPQNLKDMVLADLSGGLEYLYSKAKQAKIEDLEKSNQEKGRQEAYTKKQEKSALSTSHSSTVDFKVSLEDLLKIKDIDEYAKKKRDYDRAEAEMLGVQYRGR